MNSTVKYATSEYNLMDDIKHNKFVLLPYELKDTYKRQFKSLKWDAVRHLWYTNTKSDWVKLEQFHIKYYDVPFDIKDDAKEVGFRWDNKNKSWYGCTYMFSKLDEELQDDIELIDNPVRRAIINTELGEPVNNP